MLAMTLTALKYNILFETSAHTISIGNSCLPKSVLPIGIGSHYVKELLRFLVNERFDLSTDGRPFAGN